MSPLSEKNTLDKNTKENKKTVSKRFAPPSLVELNLYITEKKLTDVDAESFINFYESKGWMVGKNKMKSWKATASGWHTRNNKSGQNNEKNKRTNPNSNEIFERCTRDAYD